MAATYVLSLTNITFSANKVMACLFNGSGSGSTVKIRRIWLMNNQIIAVTGSLTNLELRLITAASGGTPATPTKHDSNSSNPKASIVMGTNQTVTFDGNNILQRVVWSTDEPSSGVGSLDEFETFPMFTCIWSLGWGDSGVAKLTLSEGRGIALVNTGANQGTVDIFIEFTIE